MTGKPAIRLTFDAARCDGVGMCSLVFPEGISLDPWGFAQVTSDPISDPKLQGKARRAIAACPRSAIAAVSNDAEANPPSAVGGRAPQ